MSSELIFMYLFEAQFNCCHSKFCLKYAQISSVTQPSFFCFLFFPILPASREAGLTVPLPGWVRHPLHGPPEPRTGREPHGPCPGEEPLVLRQGQDPQMGHSYLFFLLPYSACRLLHAGPRAAGLLLSSSGRIFSPELQPCASDSLFIVPPQPLSQV